VYADYTRVVTLQAAGCILAALPTRCCSGAMHEPAYAPRLCDARAPGRAAACPGERR